MSKLSIEYCVSWNYYPYAAGLAEEINKEFDFEIEFKKSHGGRFEIVLDDQLLFSKAALDRFPEKGEIVHIIKEEWRIELLNYWIDELMEELEYWSNEVMEGWEESNYRINAI